MKVKMSQPKARRYIRWFFALAAIEALICLVWLLAIPSDVKNSFIGQYSASRLAMAVLLLAVAVVCAGAAISRRLAAWVSQSGALPISNHMTLVGSIVFLISGLLGTGLLLIAPGRFGDLQYAFARLKPLIAWPVMVCLQLGFVLTGLAYRRNQTLLAPIREDFKHSLANRPGMKMVILPLLAGGLAGAMAALAFTSTARQVLSHLPWIAAPGLFFGLLLIAWGLVYNRSLVRLAPLGFLALLLCALAANALITPAAVRDAKAAVRPLADDSAIGLGSQFHYSLSVYHILSVLYPESEIVTADRWLEEWNLSEERLSAWVPAKRIIPGGWEDDLNADQAKAILDLNPVEVEINTMAGTRYYYFVPNPADGAGRLILVNYKNQRFVLPEEYFRKLIEQQGKAP